MEDEALRSGILLLIPLLLILAIVILFRDWILTILLTSWMNFEFRKIRQIMHLKAIKGMFDV